MSQKDVAIVGAGPVGLLLAILLGRAGNSITVVENGLKSTTAPAP